MSRVSGRLGRSSVISFCLRVTAASRAVGGCCSDFSGPVGVRIITEILGQRRGCGLSNCYFCRARFSLQRGMP